MNVSPSFQSLGAAATFVRGITFKPADVVSLDDNDVVACLRTKNVQADIDLSDVWGVPRRLVKRSEQFLRVGDIVVSTANSWNLVGKCSWVPALPWDTTLGGFISALRARQDVLDSRYLYYWFSRDQTQAKVRQCARKTTNIANLSFDQCLEIKIPLPSLSEQRRIAAILDQADALRRKRRQALERLDGYAQAVFLDMFGDWSRPGQNIPVVQIGPHLDFLTSGSRGWAEYYREEGDLFLRIQNVKRDELDLSDVAFVEAPATAEAKRTRVRPGDVLLSITADLGRTAVVPEGIGTAYINQHLSILRTKAFEPRFLSAALSSPSGKRAIYGRNREGVKAGVNFDDIRSFQVPDVGLSRQKEFVKRATEGDRLRKLYRTHLAELNALFGVLQHRAFGGGP